MEDGFNLNLALSGATLLSVLGLAVKIYFANRPQKLEQPLEILTAKTMASEKALDEHIADNRIDHSNMFERISRTEQRVTRLEASVESQAKQLDRIDAKLDRVLEKLK